MQYGYIGQHRIPEWLGRPSAGMTAERGPPVHFIHRQRTPQHNSPGPPRAEVDLQRKEDIPFREYEGTRIEGHRLSLRRTPGGGAVRRASRTTAPRLQEGERTALRGFYRPSGSYAKNTERYPWGRTGHGLGVHSLGQRPPQGAERSYGEVNT